MSADRTGSSTPKDRSWVSAVVLVLAAVAAFFAFTWGHGDATAKGAGEDLVQTAALLAAAAAVLGVLGAGSLTTVLLFRVPGKERPTAAAALVSVVLVVAAAVLFFVVYPIVLGS